MEAGIVGEPLITRTTDGKGRVSLPRSFANATIIIEQISDTELRIRKAQVIPEDELSFREAFATTLTDRDRDLFLNLVDQPPESNQALRKAVTRQKRTNG